MLFILFLLASYALSNPEANTEKSVNYSDYLNYRACTIAIINNYNSDLFDRNRNCTNNCIPYGENHTLIFVSHWIYIVFAFCLGLFLLVTCYAAF